MQSIVSYFLIFRYYTPTLYACTVYAFLMEPLRNMNLLLLPGNLEIPIATVHCTVHCTPYICRIESLIIVDCSTMTIESM